MAEIRTLSIVLGDQLDRDSELWRDFDPQQDAVWMAEVAEESTHVWTHKARIVCFLAAMRLFRDELVSRGYEVRYRELSRVAESNEPETLAGQLLLAIKELKPERLCVVQPGEHRVLEALQGVADESGRELSVLPDAHFYTTPEDFAAHAEGRKQVRLEYFYRELRKRFGVLMQDGQPVGGEWNYDKENRGSFGKNGPTGLPAPVRFEPDSTTREVIELVNQRFAGHLGDLGHFDWPLTPKQAEAALVDFIEHRLARFGQYQDAIWSGEPWLYHSRLSAAMNLKLINPRRVVQAAVDALEDGKAPLNAVEGFVRQILGWREYVRGVYWNHMPEYLDRNAMQASAPLPKFYWTAETEMTCLADALSQTLQYGYAHHIQRLMITGLFALLLGVDPKRVHEWYLAVYVDAVEWVELPNTLGMSQFADGGIMASKPYVATGAYIKRMSNHCAACPFDPSKAVGENACPFTTLYWDYLDRHRERLTGNRRMSLQLKNLDKKEASQMEGIRDQAEQLRAELTADLG